jgi:hypothetical protein
MKTRNTLILFVLAIGLFAFIQFYERNHPSTREAEERASYVVQFDRDKIDRITITSGEDRIELKMKDNQWYVESPVKDRADSAAIAGLLTGLEGLRKEAVVSPEEGKKPELKEYGLSKPGLRVKLSGKDSPPEIFFGKDAAVEGKVYVRLDKSDTAFLVSNEIKAQVTRKADDFRDRRLTNLTTAQVTKFAIRTGAGELEVQKEGDHWQLKKPLAARADDSKVADVLAQALTTRIDTFFQEENPAGSGLQDRRGTVTFYSEGERKPVVLQVGVAPEKEKEKVHASVSNREGSFLVPKKIEELLALKPNDLRDKHLVRVNFDTVDRINIEPAGRARIVLARREEAWTIKSAGDKAASAAEIRRFVNDLEKAEVAAFVADVASDLQKYGLAEPRLKLTLSAYASENTAESKAGENEIVTVLFGNAEGGNVYAKLDDEPFVVAVPGSVYERIFIDPVQWQETAIVTSSPADIVSVEVTRQGQQPVTLARTDKGWTAAGSEAKPNKTNIQSMLNTLAALRAARWASPADMAGGEKAGLTITFRTKDGQARTVNIGAATPDGMWLGTASGVEGTFVLPRPDVEALQLPLLEARAGGSPSPAAADSAVPGK